MAQNVGDGGHTSDLVGTLGAPPSWCAEEERSYTFRAWMQDLQLWQASAVVDVQRQGPLAALRLRGSARELAREIDDGVLQGGGVVDGIALTGLAFLVAQL